MDAFIAEFGKPDNHTARAGQGDQHRFSVGVGGSPVNSSVCWTLKAKLFLRKCSLESEKCFLEAPAFSKPVSGIWSLRTTPKDRQRLFHHSSKEWYESWVSQTKNNCCVFIKLCFRGITFMANPLFYLLRCLERGGMFQDGMSSEKSDVCFQRHIFGTNVANMILCGSGKVWTVPEKIGGGRSCGENSWWIESHCSDRLWRIGSGVSENGSMQGNWLTANSCGFHPCKHSIHFFPFQLSLFITHCKNLPADDFLKQMQIKEKSSFFSISFAQEINF